MKRKINILAILALPLIAGCETILEYNQEGIHDMALNSIVAADSCVSVSVASVGDLNSLPPTPIDAFYVSSLSSVQDSAYFDLVVPDASVSMVVNGSESYLLTFDSEENIYKSSYKPKRGDNITVRAERIGTASVSATTVVPTAVRLEIVDCEKYFDKAPESVYEDGFDYCGTDTMMKITMRLHDIGGKHNCYRLKVRGIGDDGNAGSYYFNDLFSSDDGIFKDERLTSSFGGWKKGFSNVFDDTLFDGRQYEFTVYSRQRRGMNPRISVELESLSEDLYRYLKSTMLYRVTEQDAFTEPVRIDGNVDGGYGIVGGVSVDSHVVYF